MNKSADISKIVGAVLMSASLFLMIGSAGIKVTLFFTRPQYQQPNTGRMLPVNILGTVVYVTKGENAALAHAVPAGLIVGTIGIFLWARIKRDVLANSSVDQ